MYHFRKISTPFGTDPTSYISIKAGDVFQLKTSKVLRRTIHTSDLSFVKRITRKQAERECHRREMGHEKPPTKVDPDLDDGEDEDNEYPEVLSDSDEEPTPEAFK